MAIVVLGEVLWDVYPDKRIIGGAPFNFAAHFTKLGGKAKFVSSVGDDGLGESARESIKGIGVEDSYVKTTPDYPTGTVVVTLENGTPTYNIVKEVAYDYIALTDAEKERLFGNKTKYLYFGTLAQRGKVTRATVNEFLRLTTWNEVFFDVNIRAPHFSREVVCDGLDACTVLKLSRDDAAAFEDIRVTNLKRANFESENEYNKALCKTLSEMYRIPCVVLTLDKDGAMAYSAAEKRFVYSKKENVTVVSTVGAGDSFFAAFAFYKILEQDLQRCLDKATEVSSFVVSKVEAIPQYPDELLVKLMK